MIKNIADSSLAIAKIAGKGILKYIVFIGFSLLVFSVAVFMIGNTEGGSGISAAGHTGIFGAILGVLYLFVLDFWPMLLCTTSLVLFPFLYFTLINKGIIHTSLFQLWKKNLEGWFISKISNYSTKYLSGENTVSKINDIASVKLKLASDIKNDKTNSRWQRKILAFILKKIKLDDFDTNNTDEKISDFIVNKAVTYISDLGEPSNKPIYITFGVHLILIVFAIVFNN